jgi:hypothetical protein
MDNINNFFRKLYSNPALVWKAVAGLLFVGLSLAMFFAPTFINGLDKGTRIGFAFLLLIYGLFRLSTFYIEYNRKSDE